MGKPHKFHPFEGYAFDESRSQSGVSAGELWYKTSDLIDICPPGDRCPDEQEKLFFENSGAFADVMRRRTGGFAHFDLLLLQDPSCALASVFHRIGEDFRSLEVFSNKGAAFREASLSLGHQTVFAIDLDSLGHIDRAIPRLMRLKKVNPLLSVLLLSRHFNGNDMSSARCAIADASLRLPADAEAILHAIRCAVNNARSHKVM